MGTPLRSSSASMANISNTPEPGPSRLKPAKVEPSRVEFRRLVDGCDTSDFSCGYTIIDNFFSRRALLEHTALFSRAVTAHIDGDDKPIAFYAMAVGLEGQSEFSDDASFFSTFQDKLLQRYLPTLQLMWVAVDTTLQRRGIGTLLMGRALDDFFHVSDKTGISALTLKPINAAAAAFYKELGFAPYGIGELPRMFLPADSVITARLAETGIRKG